VNEVEVDVIRIEQFQRFLAVLERVFVANGVASS